MTAAAASGGGTPIKVCIRVRPFLKGEKEKEKEGWIVKCSDNTLRLRHPYLREERVWKKWDSVYNSCVECVEDEKNTTEATQETIFRGMGQEAIYNILDGINSCVFTYGSSTSGKSFSLLGTKDNPGLAPLLYEELLSHSKKGENRITLEASVYEIINDKVFDTLAELNTSCSKRSELRVREHPDVGPYVDGVSRVTITETDHIDAIIGLGRNKTENAHLVLELQLSENSAFCDESDFVILPSDVVNEIPASFGTFHCIKPRSFSQSNRLKLSSKLKSCRRRKLINVNRDLKHRSSSNFLTLCDLASSQHIGSSLYLKSAELQALSNINKSLSTLSRVMNLLASKASRDGIKEKNLPHRESIITWLLKDKLSGNCSTQIIATITPKTSDYENTLATLLFAERAKKIKSRPEVNIRLGCSDPLTSEEEILKKMLDTTTALYNKKRRLLSRLNSSEKSVKLERRQTHPEKLKFGRLSLVSHDLVTFLSNSELCNIELTSLDLEISKNREAINHQLSGFNKKIIIIKNNNDSDENSFNRNYLIRKLGTIRYNILEEEIQLFNSESSTKVKNEPITTKTAVITTDCEPQLTTSVKKDIISSTEDEQSLIEVDEATRTERQVLKMLLNGDNSFDALSVFKSTTEEYINKRDNFQSIQRCAHHVSHNFTNEDLSFIDVNIGCSSSPWVSRNWDGRDLESACKYATDGDVIYLDAGIYRSSIAIVRGFTITAAPGVSKKDVIIEHCGPTPAIYIRSTLGTVRGITVRKRGGETAIFLRGGTGTVDNCIITAHSCKSAVLITEGCPMISNCEIRSWRIGVWIRSLGAGVIKNNTISQCGDCSVVIEGASSRPLVTSNFLINGKGGGIAVGSRGRGRVTHNSISGNGCAGVLIEGGSNPTFSHNTITNNEGGGIVICGKGTRSLFEKNILQNNIERDILVRDHATPRINNNNLNGGELFGCVYCHGGGGLFTNNTLKDYGTYSILIRNSGAGLIYNNTIMFSQPCDGGCLVAGNSQGLVVNNTFWGSCDDRAISMESQQSSGTVNKSIIKHNSVNKDCCTHLTPDDLLDILKERCSSSSDSTKSFQEISNYTLYAFKNYSPTGGLASSLL